MVSHYTHVDRNLRTLPRHAHMRVLLLFRFKLFVNPATMNDVGKKRRKYQVTLHG